MIDEVSELTVELQPYAECDLPLLERANAPEMTAHLGGPESEEQIKRRHQRYLASPVTGKAQMFRIVRGLQAEPVGIVGYWEKTWRGELAWEAGWSVFPEYQGRGVAVAATRALIARVQLEKKRRYLYAFPSGGNPPSNAICRKLGFELIGECDFEYPAGHLMRCNEWRLSLES
jgi:RimJ/RimL family protein N-acetyltransferase